MFHLSCTRWTVTPYQAYTYIIYWGPAVCSALYRHRKMRSLLLGSFYTLTYWSLAFILHVEIPLTSLWGAAAEAHINAFVQVSSSRYSEMRFNQCSYMDCVLGLVETTAKTDKEEAWIYLSICEDAERWCSVTRSNNPLGWCWLYLFTSHCCVVAVLICSHIVMLSRQYWSSNIHQQ